eukprot:2480705-Amphidinium_carterae.1
MGFKDYQLPNIEGVAKDWSGNIKAIPRREVQNWGSVQMFNRPAHSLNIPLLKVQRVPNRIEHLSISRIPVLTCHLGALGNVQRLPNKT